MRGIHWSPVNSPHKGQWHRAWMLSLICTWINGLVNNCEVGDLRCHCAHYDITVMTIWEGSSAWFRVLSNNMVKFVMTGVNRHWNTNNRHCEDYPWWQMTSWAWCNLKSLASRLFAQPFVQVQIKENIKVPHHWPLWGESTGDRLPAQWVLASLAAISNVPSGIIHVYTWLCNLYLVICDCTVLKNKLTIITDKPLI